MHIQWFPGHMTKALRMMEDSVKVIDSVIYVLDARAVKACFNQKFDAIIGNRPVLYVINKADTVEKKDLEKWVKFLSDNNMHCVVTNSTTNRHVGEITAELLSINKDLIERYRDKGVNRAVRAMVIGVPNTGKSTLINSLCGGKRAITGNKPGVTRGRQWIVIDEKLELMDTPGTMSPNIEEQDLARDLAFIGSINDEILDKDELALELVKVLVNNHREKLFQRYNISGEFEKDIELMYAIGKSRGFMMKGGEIDLERTSKVIIDDFRKGRIGKIMLEYPDA